MAVLTTALMRQYRKGRHWNAARDNKDKLRALNQGSDLEYHPTSRATPTSTPNATALETMCLGAVGAAIVPVYTPTSKSASMTPFIVYTRRTYNYKTSSGDVRTMSCERGGNQYEAPP